MRLHQLIAWVPKRRHTIPREMWETQYAEGHWNHLHSIEELARYSVIVGYCEHFKPYGAVLDIGCGDGLLALLLRQSYSRYVGMDLSSEAVKRAAIHEDSKTQFCQGDASIFVPDGRFDIIVFNEVLYYFEQPLDILRRYESFLTHDGIFIISNVVSRRSAVARKALTAACPPIAWVCLSNATKRSWEVQVIAAHTADVP